MDKNTESTNNVVEAACEPIKTETECDEMETEMEEDAIEKEIRILSGEQGDVKTESEVSKTKLDDVDSQRKMIFQTLAASMNIKPIILNEGAKSNETPKVLNKITEVKIVQKTMEPPKILNKTSTSTKVLNRAPQKVIVISPDRIAQLGLTSKIQSVIASQGKRTTAQRKTGNFTLMNMKNKMREILNKSTGDESPKVEGQVRGPTRKIIVVKKATKPPDSINVIRDSSILKSATVRKISEQLKRNPSNIESKTGSPDDTKAVEDSKSVEDPNSEDQEPKIKLLQVSSFNYPIKTLNTQVNESLKKLKENNCTISLLVESDEDDSKKKIETVTSETKKISPLALSQTDTNIRVYKKKFAVRLPESDKSDELGELKVKRVPGSVITYKPSPHLRLENIKTDNENVFRNNKMKIQLSENNKSSEVRAEVPEVKTPVVNKILNSEYVSPDTEVKRKRGRPKKIKCPLDDSIQEEPVARKSVFEEAEPTSKRKRTSVNYTLLNEGILDQYINEDEDYVPVSNKPKVEPSPNTSTTGKRRGRPRKSDQVAKENAKIGGNVITDEVTIDNVKVQFEITDIIPDEKVDEDDENMQEDNMEEEQFDDDFEEDDDDESDFTEDDMDYDNDSDESFDLSSEYKSKPKRKKAGRPGRPRKNPVVAPASKKIIRNSRQQFDDDKQHLTKVVRTFEKRNPIVLQIDKSDDAMSDPDSSNKTFIYGGITGYTKSEDDSDNDGEQLNRFNKDDDNIKNNVETIRIITEVNSDTNNSEDNQNNSTESQSNERIIIKHSFNIDNDNTEDHNIAKPIEDISNQKPKVKILNNIAFKKSNIKIDNIQVIYKSSNNQLNYDANKKVVNYIKQNSPKIIHNYLPNARHHMAILRKLRVPTTSQQNVTEKDNDTSKILNINNCEESTMEHDENLTHNVYNVDNSNDLIKTGDNLEIKEGEPSSEDNLVHDTINTDRREVIMITETQNTSNQNYNLPVKSEDLCQERSYFCKEDDSNIIDDDLIKFTKKDHIKIIEDNIIHESTSNFVKNLNKDSFDNTNNNEDKSNTEPILIQTDTTLINKNEDTENEQINNLIPEVPQNTSEAYQTMQIVENENVFYNMASMPTTSEENTNLYSGKQTVDNLAQYIITSCADGNIILEKCDGKYILQENQQNNIVYQIISEDNNVVTTLNAGNSNNLIEFDANIVEQPDAQVKLSHGNSGIIYSMSQVPTTHNVILQNTDVNFIPNESIVNESAETQNDSQEIINQTINEQVIITLPSGNNQGNSEVNETEHNVNVIHCDNQAHDEIEEDLISYNTQPIVLQQTDTSTDASKENTNNVGAYEFQDEEQRTYPNLVQSENKVVNLQHNESKENLTDEAEFSHEIELSSSREVMLQQGDAPGDTEVSFPSEAEVSICAETEVSLLGESEVNLTSEYEVSITTENKVNILPEIEANLLPENEVNIPLEDEVNIPPENEVSILSENEDIIPENEDITNENGVSSLPDLVVNLPSENKVSLSSENEIISPTENEVRLPPESVNNLPPETEDMLPPETEDILYSQTEVELHQGNEQANENEVENRSDLIKHSNEDVSIEVEDFRGEISSSEEIILDNEEIIQDIQENIEDVEVHSCQILDNEGSNLQCKTIEMCEDNFIPQENFEEREAVQKTPCNEEFNLVGSDEETSTHDLKEDISAGTNINFQTIVFNTQEITEDENLSSSNTEIVGEYLEPKFHVIIETDLQAHIVEPQEVLSSIGTTNSEISEICLQEDLVNYPHTTNSQQIPSTKPEINFQEKDAPEETYTITVDPRVAGDDLMDKVSVKDSIEEEMFRMHSNESLENNSFSKLDTVSEANVQESNNLSVLNSIEDLSDCQIESSSLNPAIVSEDLPQTHPTDLSSPLDSDSLNVLRLKEEEQEHHHRRRLSMEQSGPPKKRSRLRRSSSFNFEENPLEEMKTDQSSSSQVKFETIYLEERKGEESSTLEIPKKRGRKRTVHEQQEQHLEETCESAPGSELDLDIDPISADAISSNENDNVTNRGRKTRNMTASINQAEPKPRKRRAKSDFASVQMQLIVDTVVNDIIKRINKQAEETVVKTEPKNEKNTITCAICKQTVGDWYYHKRRNHNDLAWRVGDTPLTFNNVQEVLYVLNNIYKQRKPLYCDICDESKKSVNGYLAHLVQCGKNEEELDVLKIKCELCEHRILPFSLVVHMQQHRKKEEDLDKGNKDDCEIVNPAKKRKAAKKATTLIQNAIEEDPRDSREDSRAIQKLYILDKLESKLIPKHFQEVLKKCGLIPCLYSSCTYVIDDVGYALEHIKRCEYKPDKCYMCKKCLKVYDNFSDISTHIKSEHVHELFDPENEEEFDNEKEEQKIAVRKNHGDKKTNGTAWNICKFQFMASEKTNQNISRHLCHKNYAATLEFCENNFSTILFEDHKALEENWHNLDSKDILSYLPQLKESMFVASQTVVSIKLNNKEPDLKKLKLFETNFTPKGDSVIFTGGPVVASAWVPTPYTRDDCEQILAVSVVSDPNKVYSYRENYADKGVIQFWNFGILENKVTSTYKPQLEFCLAHDFGAVFNLEWCPSGCYDAERLGLLAITSTDGSVYVYSVVHPKKLKTKMVKAKPKFNLNMMQGSSFNLSGHEFYPTRISWSTSVGHEFILVGYSNGVLAFYDLNIESVALKTEIDDTIILHPNHTLQAHLAAITGLSIIPTMDGKHNVVSSGNDRLVKYWNFDDFTKSTVTSRRAHAKDIVWMHNWYCTVVATDDCGNASNTILCYPQEFITSVQNHCLFSSCPVNAIGGSDWGSFVIQGNQVGEIIGCHSKQVLPYISENAFKRFYIAHSKVLDVKDKEVLKTYKDFMNRKLVFGDFVMDSYFTLIKSSQILASSRGIYDMPDYRKYPIQAINSLAVNPNRQSFLYFAAGYQSGFLKVFHLKILA